MSEERNGYAINNSIIISDHNGLCSCSDYHSNAGLVCRILRILRNGGTLSQLGASGPTTYCLPPFVFTIGIPRNDCACAYEHEAIHQIQCASGEWFRQTMINSEIEAYQTQLNCLLDRGSSCQCTRRETWARYCN